MAKIKQRVHNEWFNKVKATTCECGTKKTEVWTWGEYVNARFRAILRCCAACFKERVLPRLKAHTDDCGCTFELKPTTGSGPLPAWISLTCKPKPSFGSPEDREMAAQMLFKLVVFVASRTQGGVDEANMRAMQAKIGGNTEIHDDLVNYLIETGRLRREGSRLIPTDDPSVN